VVTSYLLQQSFPRSAASAMQTSPDLCLWLLVGLKSVWHFLPCQVRKPKMQHARTHAYCLPPALTQGELLYFL